jgi:hypothetical protein
VIYARAIIATIARRSVYDYDDHRPKIYVVHDTRRLLTLPARVRIISCKVPPYNLSRRVRAEP